MLEKWLFLVNIPSNAWPSIATIAGAALGSFGLYEYRNRKKKRRIRASLRAEIESMVPEIKTWAEIVYSEQPQTNSAPILSSNPFTDLVYQANASEIGSLTKEEGESIVEFYSLVIWYQRILSRHQQGEELPVHLTHVLLRRVPLLLTRANLALKKLEENSPEKEISDRKFVEFNTDEDMENDALDQAVSRFNLENTQTITTGLNWELVKEK